MPKLLNREEIAAVGKIALKGLASNNPARLAICTLLEHIEATNVGKLVSELEKVTKQRDELLESFSLKVQ